MQKLLGGPLTLDRFLEGLLLPAVSAAALRKADLRTGDRFTQEMVSQLCNMLKGMRLTVEGIGDERQCQVRRGGFPVERFSPATCEAFDVPGLFVTGEALDVDAPCGGFNLHWAWSSGMLAGRAAADRIAGGEGVERDGSRAGKPHHSRRPHHPHRDERGKSRNQRGGNAARNARHRNR